MKRLVNYDDDEDIDVPSFKLVIPPPPSTSSTQPQLLQNLIEQKRQAAKELFIENQAFDSAYLRAENAGRKTGPRPDRPTTDLSLNGSHDNLGNAETDGPWAPAPEPVVPLLTPYIRENESVKEAQSATKIEGQEDTLVKSPDLSTVGPRSSRFGNQVADYQGRRVTDPRRWPSPLSFYSDDSDIEHEEELVEFSNKKQKKEIKKSSRLPSLTAPCTREYLGHSKGITRVRPFGCLALTSGLDGLVMLWDTSKPDDLAGATQVGLADENGAIQSYYGHSGYSVADCCFPTTSADKFVSCGYDGFGLLWDTETGKVLNRYSSDMPRVWVNAAKFRTNDDNQLIFAFGDRMLRHWDIRETNERPAQTYDFHQSSVQSVVFCEHGNKFASTGEDRKLVIWDWGVPSPSKIISELWIPGMPATAVHPSTMSFISVGLDNKLFRFSIVSKLGVVKKGGVCSPIDFQVAGYACEPSFSPCGTHVACGTGNGTIHFLRHPGDFLKNEPVVTRQIVNAHRKSMPVSCVAFHPCFEGVLLSASWDGSLKWWG